jgi:hypothetical protein
MMIQTDSRLLIIDSIVTRTSVIAVALYIAKKSASETTQKVPWRSPKQVTLSKNRTIPKGMQPWPSFSFKTPHYFFSHWLLLQYTDTMPTLKLLEMPGSAPTMVTKTPESTMDGCLRCTILGRTENPVEKPM